ncbi:MAG: peptidoglycan-associated lipoprotein Pal [Pseudomonadota bacterium]
MGTKLLTLIAAAFLLVACSSTSETSPTAGGAGAGGAAVPGSQEDLVVNVGDRVFFNFDQYDLTPQGQATLQAQAAWLQQYPDVSLIIEGHADERGTREYNLALGERRAVAVRNYLIALGVSPTRLTTVSYGKERPAVVGSNDSAWAQNRRGVSVVN